MQRAAPACTGRRGASWAPLGAVSAVRATRLATSVLRMDFWDRLTGADVTHKSGSINRCYDTQCGEVLASDKLRVMLLDESSDEWATYSEAERAELIFHVLARLAVGGGLNQYDEEVRPHRRATCGGGRVVRGWVVVVRRRPCPPQKAYPPPDGILPRAHQNDLQRARRRAQARDRRARRPIDRPPRDRSDVHRRTSLPQAPNRATCPVAMTPTRPVGRRTRATWRSPVPRSHHALARPLRSHTGDRAAAGRARTTSATYRSTRRSATSSTGTMRGRLCSDGRAVANRTIRTSRKSPGSANICVHRLDDSRWAEDTCSHCSELLRLSIQTFDRRLIKYYHQTGRARPRNLLVRFRELHSGSACRRQSIHAPCALDAHDNIR